MKHTNKNSYKSSGIKTVSFPKLTAHTEIEVHATFHANQM